MAKNVTRLYASFRPENYDIAIDISKDKNNFNGCTTIYGTKTGRPSKRITLHQKNLSITSIAVYFIDKHGNNIEIAVSRYVTQASYDELRIHTHDILQSGKYMIRVSYTGKITQNMDGIYPCTYTEDGLEKKLIATQFESHHAREVFPGIDEPEAKAVFSLTITHDKNEIALSNTPVLKQESSGDKTLTKFEKTPVMSTYLVAFVIGELEYLEKTSKNGVLIRTYAVKNQINHAEFALEVATKAMDFYEDYYDIRFPLPKCDFVALPDFASGAMENWGLITFREQTLLVDEHTSVSMKQYVAIVVAHELTHQWFGNLVTMRWWTDLWLNEGFASWMEYLAVDTLFPEWDLWTQFNIDEQQSALKADSLEHTHPIEVPVHHPDEIRTIFDIISYQKGASVIHMLFNYLGENDFRDGIRHYLKSHSYKNTDTADLWKALEHVSKKPVMQFMQHWTKQSGYPLVTVSLKNEKTVTIKQQRFVTNPQSIQRSDKHTWDIPLLSENLSTEIVSKKSQDVTLKDSKQTVLLNKGMHGFYRVDYDAKLQEKLFTYLDSSVLSESERMGLLSDALETTRAGYQNIEEYLKILQHYKNEEALSVWEIISSSIGNIRQTLSSTDDKNDLRDAMKPYVNSLLHKQIERLGWDKNDNEKHLDTLLRPLIIALSASADNPETIEKLQKLYIDRIENNKNIDPDLRTVAFATRVRVGGEKEYNELTKLYENSNSSDEKLSITAALTSFESAKMHKKVLEFMTSGKVRMQDLGYWIAYSFMNRHARKSTWEWMVREWKWIKKNIGTDLSFYRMPVYAARNFATEDFKHEYVEFFEKNMEPVLRRSYDQGLEMIETNIAWRSRDAERALAWFKSQ